ncbi:MULTISPECIES: hypothetical protein [Gordonia]|uniref:hypothetical protein n=1 Tax=Gordonia TaxID=2053 RepID=UPI000A5B2E14|nr:MULTISPECIES: hypothetical protein [Gordonia]
MTDWRAPRAAAGVKEHWSLLVAAQQDRLVIPNDCNPDHRAVGGTSFTAAEFR